MADLLIRIRADEGGTKGILKGVTDSIEDAGKASEKHGNLISGFGDVLGKVGLAAMGIQAGIGAATGAIQGLIGPAVESQNVTEQLRAVLKSTGEAAGVSEAAVQNLSTALSRQTKFDDEAITGAQSLLLTFTGIGGDVMPQATEAVLNMSQALGQDLKSSSIQLGKALNDPIAGVTALRRVGVQLTDSQQALIKTMVESGDVAGAQAVILKELQTEFGGAAKAAGQTFSGQLTILQNELGNVVEAIGGPVIGVLSDLLKNIIPLVEAFGDWLPGALDDFQTAMAPVVRFLGDFLIPHLEDLGRIVADVFQGDFVDAATTLKDRVLPRIKEFGSTVVQWLVDQLPILGEKLADWAAKFIEWVGPMVPDLIDQLKDPLLKDLLGWIKDQLPDLTRKFAEWAKAAIEWVLDAAKDILPKLETFLSGVLKWLSDNAPDLTQKFISEFVPAAIGWVAQAAIDILPKLAVLLFEIGKWIITEGAPGVADFALKMGVAIVEGIVKGLGNLAGMLGDAIRNGLNSMSFDLGIFHLHNGNFTVTLPTIQLPNVTGGSTFGATLAGLQPALEALATPAAPSGGGGGGGAADPGVQHSLATNGGDYFATYNFQKGIGSSDADAARIANEAAKAAGKRRYGGPVVRGQAYVVGEGGPELFVPRADGLVVPNQGASGWTMDYERLAQAVASALSGAPLVVGVDDVHSALVKRQRGLPTLGFR